MRTWVAIASCVALSLIPAAAEAQKFAPTAPDQTTSTAPSKPGLEASLPTAPAGDQMAAQKPSVSRPNVAPTGQALAAVYVPCRQSTYPGDPWSICKNFGSLGGWVMRWGDANWGYRHIRDSHGYGPTTDDRISDTLVSGSIEVQGTARVYRKNSYGCPYKVVYETAGPQGVITAYCVG
jgi:hypothetical protein